MSNLDGMAETTLTQNPLMIFSLYTDGQFRSLKIVGENLRTIWQPETASENNSITISGQNFQEHYALFWLWVLGAYEVVRTIRQYKECFSEDRHHDIIAMDKYLRKIRVPFAKQELAGENIARSKTVSNFYAENSVIGHDPVKGCKFLVGDTQYWSIELVESVLKFLDSFTREDILRGMDQPPEGQSDQN